jgi:hypothetical protein
MLTQVYFPYADSGLSESDSVSGRKQLAAKESNYAVDESKYRVNLCWESRIFDLLGWRGHPAQVGKRYAYVEMPRAFSGCLDFVDSPDQFPPASQKSPLPCAHLAAPTVSEPFPKFCRSQVEDGRTSDLTSPPCRRPVCLGTIKFFLDNIVLLKQ